MRRLFAILKAWAETGERSEDYAEIDAIRAEFEDASMALAATTSASEVAIASMQTIGASLTDTEN